MDRDELDLLVLIKGFLLQKGLLHAGQALAEELRTAQPPPRDWRGRATSLDVALEGGLLDKGPVVDLVSLLKTRIGATSGSSSLMLSVSALLEQNLEESKGTMY